VGEKFNKKRGRGSRDIGGGWKIGRKLGYLDLLKGILKFANIFVECAEVSFLWLLFVTVKDMSLTMLHAPLFRVAHATLVYYRDPIHFSILPKLLLLAWS